jgi:hypothetical protein
VDKIVTTFTFPTQVGSTHWNFPIKPDGTHDQRYDVDSRVAGTTSLGTWRVGSTLEGKHVLRWQSVIYTTSCNIQPGNSPLKELSVNYVRCRPKWWIVGGPQRTIHVPVGAISVYVPSTMPALLGPTGPAQLAINDWNTALAGTGITFQTGQFALWSPWKLHNGSRGASESRLCEN